MSSEECEIDSNGVENGLDEISDCIEVRKSGSLI